MTAPQIDNLLETYFRARTESVRRQIKVMTDKRRTPGVERSP